MSKMAIRMIAGAFMVALIVVAVISFSALGKIEKAKKISQVRIDERILNVEVAKTEKDRELGLSGRKSLAKDGGMLFVFSGEEKTVFWMKDMLFPVDIIWIRNGRVLGVIDNADPQIGASEADLTRFPSPGPITHVLELAAGKAKELRITSGSKVSIKSLVP